MTLAAGVCAISFGWLHFWCSGEFGYIEYFAGMASELSGVALTIVTVDYLAERARKKEDVESIVWEVLYDLDYAVWVWLGGVRAFDYFELLALVKSIRDHGDKPTCYVETLLQELGNKAGVVLRTRNGTLTVNPAAVSGLETLQKLGMMRSQFAPLPNNEIRSILQQVIPSFRQALNTPMRRVTTDAKVLKQSSEAWQLWRHTGVKNPDVDLTKEPSEAVPIEVEQPVLTSS